MALGIVGGPLLLVGLIGLHVIARRSVSLRVLRDIAAGEDPRRHFDAALAARVPDLLACWLAVERGGCVEITPFGRRVARVTRWMRAIAGVRR
jgi:hypothetical protein